MPDGYEVHITRYPGGLPLGASWLIRVYDEAGKHIHSAEGGVFLDVGLREVERAIRDDQMERLAHADEAASFGTKEQRR